MTTLTRPQATDYLDGAGVELDLVLGEYADLIEATESGLSTHDHNGGDGGQIAYANLSGLPTLGTAAALDVGTTANKILQLDATAKLPAVDGSQLTNLPSVVGDHGALSGLADDDHAQYHTDARGDARYSVIAHNHAGTYEASGAVATHSALTSAVHGITAFGASLVDDASAADARTTLGLGAAASLNVGTVAGTVAAGDDARIVAAAPETTSTIGTLIAGSADKATPVDADSLAISDSAAAGILKRLSWANVKAGLNSIYARLAGAAGGQTITGGTAAGENLTLLSTSNATKGAVIFGTSSEYDHANERLGVGTLTPGAKLHALATTEQLRLGYDASNYASTTVSAAGVVANTATGGQWTYRATSSSATLGAELITNGDFATNLSGWTDSGASWSWSAGTALHTAGSSTTLSQAETVTNGATYQIGITITGRTAGSIAVSLGAVSVIGSGTETAFTATFTRTLVADTTGSVNLVITPTSDFNGAIDNVTLKLVTLGSLSPVIVLSDSAGTASVQLRASTASLSSVAVGLDAQRSLTTGANNSAIGVSAQRSLTTGANNSAIGVSAQYSLTTGANNSAIGVSAQRSLTTGANNSAIGVSAQYSLTTGANNSAIGVSAQYSLTTGASNSAIGVSAQYYLTTGANNSAIGRDAQFYLTTGSNNSAIGRAAQQYLANGSTAATIADNSVYIGANTKQSADSVTNENVFGYNATGIGSNSCVIGSSAVTKCQLYGDIILDKTVTADGTTGAQTINKTVGSVNFAAAASSLVVTNSRVTTASVIVATVATDDATMKSVVAVSAAGSFTLTANAAATAETRVNFIVIN
jgi:hypothetical protein